MADRKLPPVEEFVNALKERQTFYDASLSEERISKLAEYFRLVTAWNARLHLVAPCAPRVFATRHVLESLLALRYINEGASVYDVGSGAGLPMIPCLIARSDLKGRLVESSNKKAIFLREASARLDLSGRASVFAERFQNLEPPQAEALTCRAIERFTVILPELVSWAENVKRLLLFGGENLRDSLMRTGLAFETLALPESEKRFLFILER